MVSAGRGATCALMQRRALCAVVLASCAYRPQQAPFALGTDGAWAYISLLLSCASLGHTVCAQELFAGCSME
jgi:hypothetical protein